jgi:hypothetical protein
MHPSHPAKCRRRREGTQIFRKGTKPDVIHYVDSPKVDSPDVDSPKVDSPKGDSSKAADDTGERKKFG